MIRVVASVGVVVGMIVPVERATRASATGTTTTAASTTTSAPTTTTSAPTTTTTTPPPPRAASASPNSQLQNLEVVVVSWSGFDPTGTTPSIQGYFDHMVAIYECRANPSGGTWFLDRDCMTNNTPGYTAAPNDGNAVGTLNDKLHGVTAQDGTGSHAFQIQSGTLHNNFDPCDPATKQCVDPNIQCDLVNPCVLKVIEYPVAGNTPPFIDQPWTTETVEPTPFDGSDLLTQAPSIPLNFGPPPQCPPQTAGNLNVAGASSSSYALQTWATSLCQGANPITVSYAELGETQAKQDLFAGSTSVAVASLPPTPPAGSGFTPAPLSAGGVSITFVMQDSVTGVPITDLRLTPRLAAMLITNSGTLDPTYTLEHDAAYQPLGAWFMHPLTADPEFIALNPGFTFPRAVNGGTPRHPTYQFYVNEPMLRGDNNDDTAILTQWIASDYDAQQFLLGLDPCGAQLNRWWQGVTYPADQFAGREQGPANLHGNTVGPWAPYPRAYAAFYQPVLDNQTLLRDLLYQVPVGYDPRGGPLRANATTTSAYFAVMDTASARRSAFPQAQLIASSKRSLLANFVNESSPGPGSCTTISGLDPSKFAFVGPLDSAMLAAYNDMSANPPANGLFQPPVATTDPAAYPLAKIDYAMVATNGMSLDTAKLIASMLRYTAGPGRVPPNLAYGYTPLPTFLASQALTAADKIVQAATPPAAPSTTTTTTTTTVAIPPSTHSSVSASSVTAPANSVSPGPPATSPAATRPSPPTATTLPTVGPKTIELAAEGPVTVDAAALLTGKWLLPLVGLLALLSGVAGAVLRRRVGRTRKRTA
jgi:hypothetical protein